MMIGTCHGELNKISPAGAAGPMSAHRGEELARTRKQRMLHFELFELVDKKTFETEGEAAWRHFTDGALTALENLRVYFQARITVNNWYWGGPFQWRGYRTPECTEGAPGSEHRNGNAFDCDVKGYTAAQCRLEIMEHKNDPLLRSIMRLEGGVNWLHFDCKAVDHRIHVFKA